LARRRGAREERWTVTGGCDHCKKSCLAIVVVVGSRVS